MFQKIVLQLLAFGLCATVVYAQPKATFSPNFSGSEMHFANVCSAGAQQVSTLGTLKNVGTQDLGVLSVAIRGDAASSFLSRLDNFDGRFIPFSLSPEEGRAIEVECFPILLSGELSAHLVIETNDPNTPNLEIAFSATVEARPNLRIKNQQGTIRRKKGKASKLVLAVTVENASPTSTSLPINVRAKISTPSPVKRTQVITSGLRAGEQKTIQVVFNRLPSSIRKWHLGTPIFSGTTFFGETSIDPGRKILEGGETAEGKTFDLEFEDNTQGFTVGSR